MKRKLDIRIFAHSLVSDWNHGNVHFLRGLMRELGRMGHRVSSYEELGSWSLTNLVQQEHERSIAAIDQFRKTYSELEIFFYQKDAGLRDYMLQELRGADIVVLHEWNDPVLVNVVLSLKRELGFRALFHDTHHRAYTRAGEILRLHLHLFDGVLAFGEAIRKIYREGFGVKNVWTFHEAAAVDSFHPLERTKEIDLLWIGNWGDEERSRELQEYFIRPASLLPADSKIVAHGVRYPLEAIQALEQANIEYRGYLPNLEAPSVYSSSLLAVHVPRKQYLNGLSGVPTIRVFEALACGTPLLCAPWNDVEGLFTEGKDYVSVLDGKEMLAQMEYLLSDAKARRQLGEHGMETVRRRHTCAHRAQQMTEICEEVLA